MISRPRRAGRMPPAERRAAIVAATLPLVLQHGVGVSTRQIAEAADVAEGTIFRVFPDKDALMQAVVAEAYDPQPALRELAAVDRRQPLPDRLVACTEIIQRRLLGLFTLFDALGMTGPPPEEGRDGDACDPPASRPIDDAYFAALVDVIGADEGLLRVSSREFAHVLRLLVFSGTHPRVCDRRPLTAPQIVAVLLDGLLDRPGRDGRCPHLHLRADDQTTARHDPIQDRTC